MRGTGRRNSQQTRPEWLKISVPKARKQGQKVHDAEAKANSRNYLFDPFCFGAMEDRKQGPQSAGHLWIWCFFRSTHQRGHAKCAVKIFLAGIWDCLPPDNARGWFRERQGIFRIVPLHPQ